MLQRKFDDFHKTRGKMIENISNNDSSSGIQEQVKAIHQMVKVKQEELKEHVGIAIEDYETHDYSELFNKIFDEWRKLEMEVDEILFKIAPTPPKDESTSNQMKLVLNEKVACKSCDKKFEKNGILKHLGNMPSCKNDYEKSGELKILENDAMKRMKEKRRERDATRYKKEKEFRAQKYQDLKKDYEAFKKYEFFEKRRAGFESSIAYQYDRAKGIFENWKSIAGRGARCKKEIEHLRQAENNDDLFKIEMHIDSKIKE